MKKRVFFVSIITLFFSMGLAAEKVDLKKVYLAECGKAEPNIKAIDDILKNDPKILNKTGKNGETCLRMAVSGTKVELFDYLIAKEDLDLDAADEAKGITPVALAIALNKDPKTENNPLQKMAKILIEKGADINATNDKDENPLMLAIYRANVEIIQILLNHKEVDLKHENEREKNSLQVAKEVLLYNQRRLEEVKKNKEYEESLKATEEEIQEIKKEIETLTALIADLKLIVELLTDASRGASSFNQEMNRLEGLQIFLGFFMADNNVVNKDGEAPSYNQ